MPLAGVQLTIQQALALCYVMGWRRTDLTTAVALMFAESGRYTKAWHDNLREDGSVASTDRGLYQINDKAHPALSDEAAYNGVANTMYAFALWERNGFAPWAAYNSGAWLKYRREARLARLRYWSWRRLRSTIVETVDGL